MEGLIFTHTNVSGMKNYFFSVCCLFLAPTFLLAQSECGSSGDPSTGSCCYDCSCLQCGAVAECENLPGPEGSPSGCVSGGCNNCGAGHPTNDTCISWTENYYAGVDDDCVPIDGGLGFLIAGGLGMGVLGVRRRKELELEA